VARRRIELDGFSLGPSLFKVSAKKTGSERDLLYPLFVTLSGKRSVLESPEQRADQPYVTESIEDIRAKLDETLVALGPDADAARWVKEIRNACVQYLNAVKDSRDDPQPPNFGPALRQLRQAVRRVALHASASYRLPIAGELVDAMDAADREMREPDLGA
jgi:hypothetical protein